MHIPNFTAETSLYRASKPYFSSGSHGEFQRTFVITQLPGILVLLVFGPLVNPQDQAWINAALLASILALQVYLFSLLAKRALTKRHPARPR